MPTTNAIPIVTKPVIRRGRYGERLFFAQLSPIERDSHATLVSSVESLLYHLRDFVRNSVGTATDYWSPHASWKDDAEFALCHGHYYLLFDDHDIYRSYVTRPILYDGNYTLPVTARCDKRGVLQSILVTDKNGKRHTIQSREMTTGNAHFKWSLEHLFNTLTFEQTMRLHFIINHGSLIRQRYELMRRNPALDELYYISDDSSSTLLVVQSIVDAQSKTQLTRSFDFPDIEAYVSATNLETMLAKWSFQVLPFQQLRHRKPIHTKCIESFRRIHSYVHAKYGDTMDVDDQAILCGFLFHSFVLSALCHHGTFCPLRASLHTGLIHEPNLYTKRRIGDLIVQYADKNEDKVVGL